MRPHESPSRVSFWNIVTAERDAVADTVERLVGRADRHEVQDDPVACLSRGRHVAEHAGTGEGGFHQMRPARAERSLSPKQRLTRRVRGTVRRNVSRNSIGVDYFQPSEAAHACQG